MDCDRNGPVLSILNGQNSRVKSRPAGINVLARRGALLRTQEKGANLTSTFKRPLSLYAVVLDCRGPYLEQWSDDSGNLVQWTYTAHASLVLSVSMYAEPFAWVISPGCKTGQDKSQREDLPKEMCVHMGRMSVAARSRLAKASSSA